MDALVAAFLAIGLLVVIVLIVYLIDRINGIERETRRVAQSVVAAAPVNQEPFGGLSGKKLWDALCGRPPEGTSEHTLQEWRERFEVVLHKHIQSLFEEGTKDARRGLSGEPPQHTHNPHRQAHRRVLDAGAASQHAVQVRHGLRAAAGERTRACAGSPGRGGAAAFFEGLDRPQRAALAQPHATGAWAGARRWRSRIGVARSDHLMADAIF